MQVVGVAMSEAPAGLQAAILQNNATSDQTRMYHEIRNEVVRMERVWVDCCTVLFAMKVVSHYIISIADVHH